MADIEWADSDWLEKLYIFSGRPNLPDPNVFNSLVQTTVPTTRNIPDINFSSPQGPSDQRLAHRWTRKANVSTAGVYRIVYTTDDGMRFLVDNVLVPTSAVSFVQQPPTPYTVDIHLDSGSHQFEVQHFNTENLWVAVWGQSLTVGGSLFPKLIQADVIPPPPPPPVQEPAQPAPPPLPPPSLSNFIQVSHLTAERTYVRGTLSAVADDTLIVNNLSNSLTLSVGFTGTAGVDFSPSTFTLAPLKNQTVTVTFDPSQLETLQDGVNDITCVIDVSAVDISDRPSVSPASTSTPPIVVEHAQQTTEQQTFASQGGAAQVEEKTTAIIGGKLVTLV